MIQGTALCELAQHGKRQIDANIVVLHRHKGASDPTRAGAEILLAQNEAILQAESFTEFMDQRRRGEELRWRRGDA